MKRFGLTGGIGAGKSICAKIFEVLNVPIFNADLEAKKIMVSDDNVRAQIIVLFGKKSFYATGQLNKPYLSKQIFNDPALLDSMNNLVHPAVRLRYDDWCADRSDQEYTIMESALLFESGSYKRFDGIILVDAPESIRIKRVVRRDKVSEKEVVARIGNQMTSAKKRRMADIIIDNDGHGSIVRKVINVHFEIIRDIQLNLNKQEP